MTTKEFQIGWYTIPEDTEMINRGFACAAWWEKIAVKAGRYPVMSSGYAYNEQEHRYTAKLADRSISIKIPGVIIEDDFQSHFFGTPIGNYDTKQNTGTPSAIYLTPYAHAVAWGIIRGRSNIELLPRFMARVIEYEREGERKQTAGIFDLEKEAST